MARRFQASFLAVLFVAAFSAAVCGQTVTEAFDAGIPGAWTIVDNHVLAPGVPDSARCFPWTVNTAESMDNYTNGTPSLAATASSYNHPGQYDISLITPPFELNAGADGRRSVTISTSIASMRSSSSTRTSASTAGPGSQ